MTQDALESSISSVLETFPEGRKFKLLTSTTEASQCDNLYTAAKASNPGVLIEMTEQRNCILLATAITTTTPADPNAQTPSTLPNKEHQMQARVQVHEKTRKEESNPDGFFFVSGIQTREYIARQRTTNTRDLTLRAISNNTETETEAETSTNPDSMMADNKRTSINAQGRILQVLVYIEKVDSVGCEGTIDTAKLPIVGYTRALVIGYLDYIFNTKYLLSGAEIVVYTYSKSQPEYLFAGSKVNPFKKSLASHELNNWWRRTLEVSMNYVSLNSNSDLGVDYSNGGADNMKLGVWASSKAVVYIPNSDPGMIKWAFSNKDNNNKSDSNSNSSVRTDNTEDNDMMVMNKKAKAKSARKFWQLGIPFDPASIARSIVPSFPDDPICRLLAKEENCKITTNELFELLPFTEECGVGRQTAFFYIFARPPNKPNLQLQKKTIQSIESDHITTPDINLPKDENELVKSYREISAAEMQSAELVLFDRQIDFSDPKKSLESSSVLILKLAPYFLFTSASGKYKESKTFNRLNSARNSIYEVDPGESYTSTETGSISSKRGNGLDEPRNSAHVTNLLAGNLIKRKKKK